MGLAFHQTDCVHFKLVCIRSIEPGEELFQILLYSSNSKEWKISIEAFSTQTPTSRNGVYWNGAVHFTTFHRDHFYFKIDVEELHSLPFPVGIMRPDLRTLYFGESRDHLHLIVNNHEEANWLRYNVYEMLSDYSGWFVKYQVELDELQGAFCQRIRLCEYVFEFIDVVRGEKDEDAFIVLRIPGKLLVKYYVHDKSFKLMFNLTRSHYDGRTIFHRYIEALTSF